MDFFDRFAVPHPSFAIYASQVAIVVVSSGYHRRLNLF